jgi:O-antigen/teichoic acid export membrane protein
MNLTDKPVSTPKRSRFLNMLAGYGSANAAAQFMKMLFMLIMARYFGLEDYSDYVAAYSLASFTAIFFNLGLDTWLLREGSFQENWKLSTQKVLSLKASIGLIWAGLLIGLAPSLRPDLFGFGLLALCVADVWFDSLLITMLAVLNIKRDIKAYSVSILLLRGLKLIVLLVMIAVGSRSVMLIAGLRAAIAGGLAVAVFLMLRLDFRFARRQESLRMLRDSRAYTYSEFFSVIYMQADINLLTMLQGKVMAGIYSPALSVINALFIIPSSVYTFSIPTLSRTYHEAPQRLPAAARKLLAGITLMGIVLFAGVGLLGDDLVRLLLGAEYETTGQLITMLSPVLLLKCLEFGLASVIVALNKQKDRIFPQMIAAVMNVGLNLWLIPLYGVFGAARVYVISEVVLFLGYGIIVFRSLRQPKYAD